ncbi:MAG: primosomal protein N' [SAR202 cluster bacterium]|nr:primosomal protein N' [SAR202 cluster bacterium]
MRFAEIAVDAPTGPDRTFSYSIPDELDLSAGQSVRVPFGPRTLQGIVFEFVPAPCVEQTRAILASTSPGSLVDEHHLELARWISRYYMCSLFEAVAPMLPPGGRLRVRTQLSLNPAVTDLASLVRTKLQLRVLEYIRANAPVSAERLTRVMGDGARGASTRLVGRGILESRVQGSVREIAPRFVDHLAIRPDATEEIGHWMSKGARRAPKQAALVEALAAAESPIPAPELRKEFGASAVSRLLERRWLAVEKRRVEIDPLTNTRLEPAPEVSLTARQTASVEAICRIIESEDVSPRTLLVQGVTGSGKTEVYLAAVARCLKLGKRAIVMVPEIALTQQTIERFASRFRGKVAVLHSGLTGPERLDQWWKTHEGRFDVVVGSRSAVFAPIADLGLIVIDEEHEWTYKQHDSTPRYHARDVAIKLAGLSGAAVALGSATPDVASYYRGLRKEFMLSTLPDRLRADTGSRTTTTSLASATVVDMRQELKEGNRDFFSRLLDQEMESCLESGNQFMLFLNRRGSATQMQCRNCGHQARCPACDVSLSYHRGAQRLICHYCGSRRRIPRMCPQCLAYRLSFYGIGTQSVADALEKRFPEINVLRWDRDATRNVGEYRKLLGDFRSGKSQALVGTQMIAKGLHLPSVTLVGAVLADVGLGIPDYRAGERAFQLLCQVAGRAGRGATEGKVVIQTYQPDNYAIKAAAAQDYQGFYTKEMAFRHEQGNPPYRKLIRLLYSDTNSATCEENARRVATELENERERNGILDTEILGPMPAFPARLRGRYRWHVVLRGADPRTLLDRISLPKDWVIDVDPVALT